MGFSIHYRSRLPLLVIGVLFQIVCFAQGMPFIKTYSINAEFGDFCKSIESTSSGELIFIAGSVVEIPEDRVENQIVKTSSTGDIVWSTIWLENDKRYIGSFREGLVFTRDSVLASTSSRNGRGSGYLGLVKSSVVTGGTRYSDRFDDTTGYTAGDLHFAPDSSCLLEINSRIFDREGYYPIAITKLTLTGERIWIRGYLDEYYGVRFRSSCIDEQGNLYISFKGCVDRIGCDFHQTWVTKINPEGEILWTKNYGRSEGNQLVEPYLALLSEDRMALSWTRDTDDLSLQESPPIIYILDREGAKQDSIAFHGNWRTLSRIQTAANGDIIGAGYAWTDIGYCGWMIRVTPEAELVWERYIQDNRLADNVYTELLDVAECTDGSIAAGGLWIARDGPRDGGNTLRSWIVKLDADGCLEPGCTSDTIHLMRPVATEEVAREPRVIVQINPNPVEQQLHFVITGLHLPISQLKYTISSSDGRILQSGPIPDLNMDIDVNSLPVGLHFFSITSKHRLLAVQRFVKR